MLSDEEKEACKKVSIRLHTFFTATKEPTSHEIMSAFVESAKLADDCYAAERSAELAPAVHLAHKTILLSKLAFPDKIPNSEVPETTRQHAGDVKSEVPDVVDARTQAKQKIKELFSTLNGQSTFKVPAELSPLMACLKQVELIASELRQTCVENYKTKRTEFTNAAKAATISTGNRGRDRQPRNARNARTVPRPGPQERAEAAAARAARINPRDGGAFHPDGNPRPHDERRRHDDRRPQGKGGKGNEPPVPT